MLRPAWLDRLSVKEDFDHRRWWRIFAQLQIQHLHQVFRLRHRYGEPQRRDVILPAFQSESHADFVRREGSTHKSAKQIIEQSPENEAEGVEQFYWAVEFHLSVKCQF